MNTTLLFAADSHSNIGHGSSISWIESLTRGANVKAISGPRGMDCKEGEMTTRWSEDEINWSLQTIAAKRTRTKIERKEPANKQPTNQIKTNKT